MLSYGNKILGVFIKAKSREKNVSENPLGDYKNRKKLPKSCHEGIVKFLEEMIIFGEGIAKNIDKIEILLVIIIKIIKIIKMAECITESCPAFWESAEEIGRGGNGIIYSSANCPTVALKLSKSNIACKDFKEQFDIQNKLYECFNSVNVDSGFRKRVCILKARGFTEYKAPTTILGKSADGKCSFKMRRIFQFKKYKGKLPIQTFLGKVDYVNEVKGRGTYLGQKQIRSLLTKYNCGNSYIKTPQQKLDQLIEDMGTSIALINLVCGYTHADIEFILGKSLKDSNCYKLFIIDFDQVKKLNPKKNIDKLVEDDLEWPFTAEYYYPLQFLSKGNNDLEFSP